jgi:hypothetical protein
MSTFPPSEPRASDVDTTDDELIVRLADGRVLHVPLEWFPRLRDATPEERTEWRLIGRGVGIHWPELDEDISIRGLLAPATRDGETRRSA